MEGNSYTYHMRLVVIVSTFSIVSRIYENVGREAQDDNVSPQRFIEVLERDYSVVYVEAHIERRLATIPWNSA